MEHNFAPVCGIYCGECPFLGSQCSGCGAVKGKPFWTEELPDKICPFYDCCRNRKKLQHCGLCPEFPCRLFYDLKDPNMTEEEHLKGLNDRIEALKTRREMGTEKWIETKKKT